ncbi:MAG TPA: glutaredoxin family protein [Gaiellales bacterium]
MNVEVVLYGAPGCHLCDVAKDVLNRQRELLGFDLRVVDISGDEQLERAYREQIPVVFVAGRKAFIYRVEPLELARRVTSASQSPA